jgi:putative heme-binding domain-containing protein
MRLSLFIKIAAVLFFGFACFIYGAATVTYEIFPFPVLEAARDFASGRTMAGNIEEGRVLYESLCVQCHGKDGAGGEGPDLNRPTLSRAPDDTALRTIMRNGVGAMPAVRTTTAEEQADLIAYVRSLGRADAASVPGSATTGRELYVKMSCSACHIIEGEGTGVGPELSRVGLSRGPAYLRDAIVNPGAALPRGTMEVSRGFLEFLPVHIVTADGRQIEGLRVNEDSFTIQIRDAENRFHSFHKSELRELRKQPDRSVMPSYQDEFSESELNDIVAYLSSLRG